MEITLEPLSIQHYEELKNAMMEAYDGLGSVWEKEKIQRLIQLFPEGQLCVLVDNKVAAVALSIVVQYNLFGDNHTYSEITGNETFNTHNDSGDILYGIEVFVSPDFRAMRLGRRLYDGRKELCERLNLKAIVIGGRIPHYHLFSKALTPLEYINKVRTKEAHDPVLTFQLSNDFHIVRILKNYLPGDTESEEYAVLLRWNNVFYAEKPSSLTDSNIRLGLVQWQMRLFKNLEEFYQQIEFFVNALSGYQSDFAVFPELFNSPLLASYNNLSEYEAMRKLAEKTEEIKLKMSEFAISKNINIIAGSMPCLEDDKLYNVSYLLHRNGKIDEYRKIHITPYESKFYAIVGGNQLKAFDTDCGKIGILVCYDVEFPELSRILAEQGMKILFVPYLTDTQNAYTRVRNCAAARAIENECYVAITGCVGNLPGVNNMDIQFGQSAVFTPSEFAFPSNGVKGESTPNTEMTLIVDVDLNPLKDLHHFGSVKNLLDRRTDLYEIKWKK
ncbi:carbon-nitrogen hydrolase family protein [Rhizosphaericola mali]|uniref:Carbon-nitrogen hydrolase family protein n=1 Tax=Rhizosphaericola mali TaxID=2545455 RepID=A0A5P2G8T3_9BACT|nr:carbon-nitrogen hydrolase family protein [Rhizosphaericola mali]QES89623.1 carbon-nitrogen hydrolase family protein [Rhizosphaericola mali]